MKKINNKQLITVLLAEDHTIVRQGLWKLLEMEDNIKIVGEAATAVMADQSTVSPCSSHGRCDAALEWF